MDRSQQSSNNSRKMPAKRAICEPAAGLRQAPVLPWDVHFMKLALDQARGAARHGDIPVGAIVVRRRMAMAGRRTGGDTDLPEIVGLGENRRHRDFDPTAHAEILALRAAGEKCGQWQLTDCDLYVTLEPCPMCAGALVNARISRVIFGCFDPKAGAVETLFQLTHDARLNHRVIATGGVCSAEAAGLLKRFFADKRKSGKSKPGIADGAA